MRFLVDAHLPRRLCEMLAQQGHDATHTLDLRTGNATKDHAINRLSFDEQRVLVSKDADFLYSHMIEDDPARGEFLRQKLQGATTAWLMCDSSVAVDTLQA